MDTLYQLARSEPLFLLIMVAIVAAFFALLISFIVEEDRRYRAIRAHLKERIAEEEAKRGIRPVDALPWYGHPAVSGLLVGFSQVLGLFARPAGFCQRLGDRLLGLVKRSLVGIPSFLRQNWEGAGRAIGQERGEKGRWGTKLFLAAMVLGLSILSLIAGVGILMLAALYSLLWLLVKILAAISGAFSATSGWLGDGAAAIDAKVDKQAEIRRVRQEKIVPHGIIFYHPTEDAARTGKIYKGFLPRDPGGADRNGVTPPPTKLVLLINGTGYWFERPERLRRHTAKVVVGAAGEEGLEEKKEIKIGYDEAEIFQDLSGAGTTFEWRSSKWRLLDAGDCEVELHGSHPHFRSVALVPFEKVRYWLAMAVEEGEKKEGPNEVLLVEEILGTWGEHQGLVRIFAWTGIELPEGEIEEARVFLASFHPEEIKAAMPATIA